LKLLVVVGLLGVGLLKRPQGSMRRIQSMVHPHLQSSSWKVIHWRYHTE